MGSRGRSSAAELMVLDSPAVALDRPDAPYDLTDLEADEWRAIVRAMPPTHFARSQYPMLSQLCRHVVAARRVSQMIDQCAKAKRLDEAKFARLLALQNRETEAIMRLERMMRLAQLSVYNANSAKIRPEPALTRAPWDAEQDA